MAKSTAEVWSGAAASTGTAHSNPMSSTTAILIPTMPKSLLKIK